MGTRTTLALGTGFLSLILTGPALAASDTLADAVLNGKAAIDLRLRYEMVDQDNTLRDADGLTLRTRLGWTTDSYEGLSAMVEFEDSRTMFGIDDYNNTQTGKAGYSVIADPETTEVDQAFLKYVRGPVTARLGRQVITFDNQRFVGHVGWRQDRQTFDAARISWQVVEDVTLDYAWLIKRNRILAESGDQRSSDHLGHASWKTGIGTLSGYAYLLDIDNVAANDTDTFGLRFSGSRKLDALELLYTLEFADQDMDGAATSFDAHYYAIEGGATYAGITGTVGYEVLGSDNGNYGFATPLATLHAFNGWADQFLATPANGLTDLSVSLAGKVWGVKWKIAWHDFGTDEDAPTFDDLGQEIDLLLARKFGKHYTVGIKYAHYEAGDTAAGRVDADKLWIWASAAFAQ